MSIGSKSEELAFHADRIKESTILVLKSVALDPRISPEDKLAMLTQISALHVEMAEMIHTAIEGGIYNAMSEIADGATAPSVKIEPPTGQFH